MQIIVRKWGNSLGVRIPPAIREDLKLTENSRLQFKKTQDGWVLQPVPQLPVFHMHDLVAAITPENLHTEFDEGKPVGKEVW